MQVSLKLKELPFEGDPDRYSLRGTFEPGYGAVEHGERVVPTFLHDGHSVFQSLAITEYIEEVWPEPRLLPENPRERAYARALALMRSPMRIR